MIIALMICMPGVAADIVRVELPDGDKPLAQEIYGVNCEMMRRMSYRDPGFQEIYLAAGRPIIRYPGGTTANYYNPFTGFFDVIAGHEHRSLEANEAIRKRTGGRGEPYAEFFSFVNEVKAPYSITLNICTVSTASNVQWLSLLNDRGIRPRYIELGNEVYYQEYADFFADGWDYASRCEELSTAIRRIFPEAAIGVVIPNAAYTDEVFLADMRPGKKNDRRSIDWIDALRGKSFFDAVILHLYSVYGMPADIRAEDWWPLSRSYRFAMAHQDSRFDESITAAAKTFPGKAVWLTEYHLGGWSGSLKQYPLSDSYLGSLHSVAMLMKIIQRPEITAAQRNTFTAMLGGTRAADGVTRIRNNNWRHFYLFGEAIRASDRFSVPRIDGGGSYSGEGIYEGSYPDISAIALWKGKSGWLFVLNKCSRTYRLSLAERETPIATGETICYSPRTDVSDEKAFEDRYIMSEQRLPALSREHTLPPYSITRVKISR